MKVITEACHTSKGCRPATHNGDLGSIPMVVHRGFEVGKVDHYTVFTEYFGFPLPIINVP
jgi:hypothetical protein